MYVYIEMKIFNVTITLQTILKSESDKPRIGNVYIIYIYIYTGARDWTLGGSAGIRWILYVSLLDRV